MIYILKDDKIKANCIDYIKSLDGVWDIEINKHKNNRSLAQSRLYHMWVGIISKDTGNSHDELCEIFKLKFLGSETINAMGYKIERPKSTTKLNTQEFTDYLDKIEALATSIDIRLPHPQDLYYEAMLGE